MLPARKSPYIFWMVTSQRVRADESVYLCVCVCLSSPILGQTTPASDSLCMLGLLWAHLGFINTHTHTHKSNSGFIWTQAPLVDRVRWDISSPLLFSSSFSRPLFSFVPTLPLLRLLLIITSCSPPIRSLRGVYSWLLTRTKLNMSSVLSTSAPSRSNVSSFNGNNL